MVASAGATRTGDPCLPRAGAVAKIARRGGLPCSSRRGPRSWPGSLFGYCAQRGGFCLTRALSNWVADGRHGDHARLRAGAARRHRRRAPARARPGRVDPRPPLPLAREPHRRLRLRRGHDPGRRLRRELLVPPGRGRARRLGRPAGLRDGRERGERRRAAVGPDDASGLRVRDRRPAGDAPRSPRRVSPWAVIGVLVVVLGRLARPNRPEEDEHGKWRWPVTGGAIGLVIVLGWYLSALGREPHRHHLRRQHRPPPHAIPWWATRTA